MPDYKAYLTALAAAVATAGNLPAKLTAAGLTQFDEYLADTPRNPDTRQLGFFQGIMSRKEGLAEEEDEIMVHATLLGDLDPVPYIGPIEAAIRAVDPEVVGKQTLNEIEIFSLYAGMPPEGADRAYIQFSLIYTKELDDCDLS